MHGYADEITRLVRSMHSHPTAQELFAEMKNQGSKISQATVYNNLNALCDGGGLRRVVTDGMPDRYDVIDRHDHIMCPQCGQLTDICIEDITALIESELGCAIDGYDLRAYVLCDTCRTHPTNAPQN